MQSQSAIEVWRFLAWSPVDAVPVDRPGYASGGKLTRHDATLQDVLAPAGDKLSSAFVDARFAARVDGMMIVDLRFDLNELPQFRTLQYLENLATSYAQRFADYAKTLNGHTHYFHTPRAPLPNVKADYRMLNRLKAFYRLLLIMLLLYAVVPSVVAATFPDVTLPHAFDPKRIFGWEQKDAATFNALIAIVAAFALVGDVLWLFIVEVSLKNWPKGPESPNVVLIAFGVEGLPEFAASPLPTCKPERVARTFAGGSTVAPDKHVRWMTDEWLAKQFAIAPSGAYGFRRALAQLRRRHLRVVQEALFNVEETSARYRRLDRLQPVFWRFLLTTVPILLVALIIRRSAPFGDALWIWTASFVAITSGLLFLYYTFVSYLRINQRVVYLRNVLGYVGVANNMNPIAEAILSNAAASRQKARSKKASPVQVGGDFGVGEFENATHTIQTALDHQLSRLHTSTFRAAMSIALLAVLATLLVTSAT